MTTQSQSAGHAVRSHSYGGPEQMRCELVMVPSPAPGEVQIRQHAIGINYLDTYHRRGVFPLPQLPGALGVEGAGEVVAVGAGVTRFRPGQRVTYASRPIGSYASLRNLPEKLLLHLPDGVSYEEAAAVTLQGLTAHMLLQKVAPVAKGQTVLVHAAAGGLGSLLTQWARQSGARVIGTVGSAEKAEFAMSRGCDDVILYREENFTSAVDRLTGGEGVDVVFEGLGGQIFHESLTVIKPFGQLVNLGQVAEGLPTVALADLGPARSVSVSVPGIFAYMNHHTDLQSAAEEVFARVRAGSLRVHIGGRWPLQEAARPHYQAESPA